MSTNSGQTPIEGQIVPRGEIVDLSEPFDFRGRKIPGNESIRGGATMLANQNKEGSTSNTTKTTGRLLLQYMTEEGLKLTGKNPADMKPRLRRVVERIFTEAENGNMVATNILLERILGKAPAKIEIEDENHVAVLVIKGASTSEL